MKHHHTLGFIGGGFMAEAIIKGILTSNLLLPSNIYVGELNPSRQKYLQNEYKINISSNNISVRKLSFKIWKKIHKLIYIITPLAGFHYFLLTKADKREPIIYLFIIFILISWRIFNYFSKKES